MQYSKRLSVASWSTPVPDGGIATTGAQLPQAQTLEATARLAGGVAHDFNNLLAIVLGYCDLLLERSGQEADERSQVLAIKRAGERAADLTRQLLAFSRQQMLNPRIVDLGGVIARMGLPIRGTFNGNVAVRVDTAPDLWNVKVDPAQFERLMMSLLGNADDAMPRGGSLSIAVENVELGEHLASERPGVFAGPHVMVTIKDTGSGMDADTLAHAFDPFFTTKEKAKRHVGLGLPTVLGIVQQSGGHIAIESTVGRGTTFTVYFPRVEGFAATTCGRVTASAPRSGGETILLVDDEISVRVLVGKLLEAQGYVVLEAESSTDAIETCRNHGAPIHLLLTDVMMPQLSGRELVRQAQPLRPTMKVLYMSGYTDDAVAGEGVLDPGTTYLQKPFTAQTLHENVRETLQAGA